MRLLFLGSPGAGKGTYAQVLEKELGIPHISTGDLLREEIKKGSELGKRIEGIMQSGNLVPDEVILELTRQRIARPDCVKGFILDGFPRNLYQAAQLKELVEITHVLNFKADDEVIVERLSGRITCGKCSKIYHKEFGYVPEKEGACDVCGGALFEREDDKPAAVLQRLKTYHEKTRPLIDHYREEGLLVEILINKPISEIREQLVGRVKEFLDGKRETIGRID